MASINLYPPIIDTYMPAYLNPIVDQCQKCRIYFALSSMNTADEILYVQLSLINQKTNQSALNPILYPNGIKMVKFSSVLFFFHKEELCMQVHDLPCMTFKNQII